ncbi:hypothetical protein D3P07_03070 [Paenibacillus sp. 1011MAR3C5]|uniref:hypothetical protein n=1 Tax=Paenibacillus sp. 1011MAR3C5 TaxID=1675787 RepID=UPI000E6BE5F1|nr:hypothetical protein [Paenibacillus sp. 1011MAR3C5]RJE91067.1 hypothetical protein D3P07_03070 [Paenibacillus sp. 1011MAR3C5]
MNNQPLEGAVPGFDAILEEHTPQQAEELAMAKAEAAAYGGQGGLGGQGGVGGQALNITYVDNFALLMILYPLIQMLNANNMDSTITFSSIESVFETVLEQQKEQRKALLDAIKAIKKSSHE